MSTATLRRQMPKTYPELVRLMPPRAIHDDIDLANVSRDCRPAGGAGRIPTKDQADYLETLSTLVAAYEDAHHPIDVSRLGPLETLKFLLEGTRANAPILAAFSANGNSARRSSAAGGN